jgi:hypothetical protein
MVLVAGRTSRRKFFWRITGGPYQSVLFRSKAAFSSPASSCSSSVFPTHHDRSDRTVASLTGEDGRCSSPQCHDFRLPGRTEGWLRPPEARISDQAPALPD